MSNINWTKEHYNKEDWIYRNDIIETPSLNFLSNKIMYNQKDIHKNCCFLHWPFWTISDITWYRFTNEERQALVDFAWTTPYADPEWWGYLSYWMKWAIENYNKNHWTKEHWLEYYQIPVNKFEQFMDKGYSIDCGYHTSKDFSQDKYDDWEINFSGWDYTPWKWWHCVRMFKKDWKIKIVNNYPSTSNFNIFEIEDIMDLYRKWILFANWYVVMIKDGTKDWYEWLSLEDKIEKLRNRPEVKK